VTPRSCALRNWTFYCAPEFPFRHVELDVAQLSTFDMTTLRRSFRATVLPDRTNADRFRRQALLWIEPNCFGPIGSHFVGLTQVEPSPSPEKESPCVLRIAPDRACACLHCETHQPETRRKPVLIKGTLPGFAPPVTAKSKRPHYRRRGSHPFRPCGAREFPHLGAVQRIPNALARYSKRVM
jgi:hypothetical protein